ncbi:MAG: OmpH family outer membrane protein [Phycisphaerae bacterium]|nr:OmpH family outer membrane protein [Phycisphaerae bacterium]
MKISYAILGAGALVLAAAAAFPSRPAVVATVDIEKIFAEVAETKANETKVRQMADVMTAERDRMSRELQDLQAELESFKSGSPPWNEAFRKIEEAVATMRAQEQYSKLKLEGESATLMRDMYARIKSNSEALAKEHKIDYVIVNDSLAEIEPANMQGTKQQMALRRFLYASKEFDLTAELIARLDADFKSRGGTVPAAAASAAGNK